MSNATALYRQIEETLSSRIYSGAYAPGSSLPSLRKLADEFGVNIATMQRAVGKLDHKGLTVKLRGRPRVVTDSIQEISRLQHNAAAELIGQFVKQISSLSFSMEEITAMILQEYQ